MIRVTGSARQVGLALAMAGVLSSSARAEEGQTVPAAQPLVPVPLNVGSSLPAAPMSPQQAQQVANFPAKLAAFRAIKTEGRNEAGERAGAAQFQAPPHPPGQAPQPPPATSVDATPVENTGPAAGPSAPQAPPSGITFTKFRSLTAQEGLVGASDWCEPNVAIRGNEVLVTFNILASFSSNGGLSFSGVNPTTVFQDPQRGQGADTFYGDQLTVYRKGGNQNTPGMMLWLMQQHVPSTLPSQRLRLAVANDTDLQSQSWPGPYEFRPQDFPGAQADEWFDFPAIATTDRFLYLSCNIFGAAPSFPGRGAIVMRFELDQLRQHQAVSPRSFRVGFQSLRAAQGAVDTMYFGTHVRFSNNSQGIRVFRWKDDSDTFDFEDVGLDPWSNAQPQSSVAGITQFGAPTIVNWLEGNDGRITAGWFDKRRQLVGFGWTAAQDNQFVQPHVRFALVRADDIKTKKGEARLSNPNFAFAYASVSPDRDNDGDLGITVLYGGGTSGSLHAEPQSFAVGTMDGNDQGTSWTFNLRRVAQGLAAIDRQDGRPHRSGDYSGIQPHPGISGTWVSANSVPVGSPQQITTAQPPSGIVFVQFSRTTSTQGPQAASAAAFAGLKPENLATKADLEQIRKELEQIRKDLGQISKDVRRPGPESRPE